MAHCSAGVGIIDMDMVRDTESQLALQTPTSVLCE